MGLFNVDSTPVTARRVFNINNSQPNRIVKALYGTRNRCFDKTSAITYSISNANTGAIVTPTNMESTVTIGPDDLTVKALTS